MNKIIIKDDVINLNESDGFLEIIEKESSDIFDVKKLEINVLRDTDLSITYMGDVMLDVYINQDGNNLNIKEFNGSLASKIQYHYNVDNAVLNVFKIYESECIREASVAVLGDSSKIDFKTEGMINGKANVTIYHDFDNTESNIELNNSGYLGLTLELNQKEAECRIANTCSSNKIDVLNEGNAKISSLKSVLKYENDKVSKSI